MNVCKICGNKTDKLFNLIVLKKYEVAYYRCMSCAFIQTEEPYWLEEAYSSAITSLDIGLIQRNVSVAPLVEVLIKFLFDQESKFVDYGGGYGMFVRLMRDRGFDFYRQDVYCQNLFANDFDVEDQGEVKYNLVTAFEVFEHLVNPLEELKKMLKYSDSIFFTTSIYPDGIDLKEWWYMIPETGQHVSLYSLKSLEYIANLNSCNFYTFNGMYHLITKKNIPNTKYSKIFSPKFRRIFNLFHKSPKSLLMADFNKISSIEMRKHNFDK